MFSLFYRYIYVVEFFDQKVHVLERKEDNSLANVKVANKTDLPQQCGSAFLTVFLKFKSIEKYFDNLSIFFK